MYSYTNKTTTISIPSDSFWDTLPPSADLYTSTESSTLDNTAVTTGKLVEMGKRTALRTQAEQWVEQLSILKV